MRSLRRRAIFGGLAWAVMIVLLGGFALQSIFDSIAQKRFDETLQLQHLQVAVALGNSSANPEQIYQFLIDPAYAQVYSGHYWQITGPEELTLTSHSLFDALLNETQAATTTSTAWSGQGPVNPIRGLTQKISLDDNSVWVVSVAESVAALDAERQEIQKGLFLTFAFVGALGIAGAILQASVVLQPLNRLREDVIHRWDSTDGLVSSQYPEEVAPLVSDINTLLDRNKEIVERARRQAADMAHALKTPSAVLRNELSALDQESVDVGAAQNALGMIDAQIKRSLGRFRAVNSSGLSQVKTDLGVSINRMARLFKSMPETDHKNLEVIVTGEISIPMDSQDIEEVLGNLLENAFSWCRKNVRITAKRHGDEMRVEIEDDGPGIPDSKRREALKSGGRLDLSAPGTGLGLAIASDLLQAYGGKLDLTHSEELGGLRIILAIPTSRVKPLIGL